MRSTSSLNPTATRGVCRTAWCAGRRSSCSPPRAGQTRPSVRRWACLVPRWASGVNASWIMASMGCMTSGVPVPRDRLPTSGWPRSSSRLCRPSPMKRPTGRCAAWARLAASPRMRCIASGRPSASSRICKSTSSCPPIPSSSTRRATSSAIPRHRSSHPLLKDLLQCLADFGDRTIDILKLVQAK